MARCKLEQYVSPYADILEKNNITEGTMKAYVITAKEHGDYNDFETYFYSILFHALNSMDNWETYDKMKKAYDFTDVNTCTLMKRVMCYLYGKDCIDLCR